jgi:potassium/chloride transporter 4/5/6
MSLSAIATNGVIPAGGPYYVISRGLGPSVGGAVGVLFYLGNSIAGAMYVVGAVEIFILYIYPKASIFGDADSDPFAKANATRVYGSALLLLVQDTACMDRSFGIDLLK